ncbi:hypothetical protein [Paracoccus lutimaris]|uniref:Dolichyl-phosphate-mannose-protein mannosyltransferase n=1 Tax=Paracoccus lutimaris TaxID=1490030 RepID=A0A368YLF3_9RHOB|nr:hypothetical protein [Paracoccus lutimaris]RCW81071.1 hypothetical protein DFP89_11677 [Paracoccus lutimaris]
MSHSFLSPPLAVRRALILLWLISAPVLCLIYLKIEPSPDQAQFDYMGWLATQGYPFYAGSFDMNWPGAMLLHETAVRLFGPVLWAWHLTDFLLMQLATLAAALFLWRSGFRLAPFVALVLYPPVYVTAGGWMAGQRDIVAMGLLIIACCAMLAPMRRELPAMILAGVLVGCAVLIRPTYLSVLAGLMILEAVPRAWVAQPRRHGVLARIAAPAAGFALVILATVLWALAVGNLDDWHQQSVQFTAQVYYDKPPMDLIQTIVVLFTRWWHWMTLCGGIGLALWILRDRGLRYPLLLVIGLGLAILMSYFVQRKGFGYHIAGFLPLLVMLTAVALDQGFARMRGARSPGVRKLIGAAAIAMTALVVLGIGAKVAKDSRLLSDIRQNGISPIIGSYDIPAADQVKMVEIIRNESTPEDRVLQYGTSYQVPYLAQRLPPHRFITPAIELMTPDFTLYAPWMAEIRAGLQEHPPKFVLIGAKAITRTEAGILAPAEAQAPVLTELLSYVGNGYEMRMQGEFGILFERVSQ